MILDSISILSKVETLDILLYELANNCLQGEPVFVNKDLKEHSLVYVLYFDYIVSGLKKIIACVSCSIRRQGVFKTKLNGAWPEDAYP